MFSYTTVGFVRCLPCLFLGPDGEANPKFERADNAILKKCSLRFAWTMPVSPMCSSKIIDTLWGHSAGLGLQPLPANLISTSWP